MTTTPVSHVSDTTSSTEQLQKNAIGLSNILYFSLAGAAFLAAAIANIPLIAAQAGASAPLVFIGTGIGLFSFVPALVFFSRRLSSAGGFAAWVGSTFGNRSAFLTGWLMTFGYALFTASVLVLLGSLTHSAMSTYLQVNLPGGWVFYAVLSTLIVFGASLLDIRFGAWGIFVFMLLELVALFVLNFMITITGGADGHDLIHTFTLAGSQGNGVAPGGIGGIFVAMVLGIWMFVGFDTGVAYAEEARNAKRAVPISLIAALIALFLMYVWSAYSAVIGVGWTQVGEQLGKNAYQAYYVLGATYVGPWFAGVMNVLNITSNLACALTFAMACGRYLFDLGREQRLPRSLGKTHPRWKSPHIALLTQGVITLAIILLFAFIIQRNAPDGAISYALGIASGDYTQTDGVTPYLWLVTMGTMAILLVFLLVNAAACVVFVRQVRDGSRKFLPSWWKILLPIVSSLFFALPIASFILPALPGDAGGFFTQLGFAPTPFPMNIVPLLVGIWIVIGIAIFSFQGRKVSSEVFSSEEEAEISVEEESPVEEKVSVEEESPVEEKVSVEEESLVEEKVSVEEESLVEEKPSVELAKSEKGD